MIQDATQSSTAETARRTDRPIQVGWILDTNYPTFLFEGPRPVTGLAAVPASADAGAAGAPDFDDVRVDEEWHYFEVPSPYNLRLKPVLADRGRPELVNALKGPETISPRVIDQIAVLVDPNLWRDPQRPVVQVSTPFRFVADDPLWLTQLPPFNTLAHRAWPGAFVAGRFPVHIWPRSISWAFEWHDTSKELVLEQGAPWFYLKFESTEPMRPIEVVAARMTPELRQYCSGLDGVVRYVNRTFSLFGVARSRRPATLMRRADDDEEG